VPASAAAEAASTDDFQRLSGTTGLYIDNLSQPRLTAELRWRNIPLANGRFHGQDHSEGWGIFHTNAYVGAFCAKRQLQQWPEPSQFRRCCKRSA
ncbi:hypothetical protein, partial [Candidatus Synechococcus spongiarum]